MTRQIWFIAYLLVCLCTGLTAFGKGNYRIPFRTDKSWGVSDETGTLIIPCKYKEITCQYPYIMAAGNGKDNTVILFDYNGKLIDSCYNVIPLGGSKHCVLHKAGHATTNPFKANDALTSMYQNQQFQAAIQWGVLPDLLTAYILDSGKRIKSIEGKICAIASTLDIALASNDQCGIYSLTNDSFIIKPIYKNITFIKPEVYLVRIGDSTTLLDKDGKLLPFHPDENALYLHKSTGNYVMPAKVTPSQSNNFRAAGYTLFNDAHKELINAERDWDYGRTSLSPQYIKLRKPKDQLKYGQSVFQVADLNGNIIIPSAQEIEVSNDTLLHIVDIGPGPRREFSYNLKTMTEIPSGDSSQRITPNTAGFREIKKDGMHYFYTPNGELITAIADTTILFRKDWNLYKKIELRLPDSVYRSTGVFQHTYWAFRNDTAKPYVVFDEHFNKIDRRFEAFTPFANGHWTSFRRHGKWGLLDNEFKEVIPPIYDNEIRDITDSTAVGIINGSKKFIFISSGRTVSIDSFDLFNISNTNNKRLAVQYLPPQPNGMRSRMVKTVFITDNSGAVLDTLTVNDIQPFQYSFTGTGNILKSPDRDYHTDAATQTYNLATKKPKQCPYPVFSVEKCNGRALLLQCQNDKGELGMLSADNFSIVVPFGKYDFMFTYPEELSFKGHEEPVIDALIIKGGTNAMHHAANSSRFDSMLRGQAMKSDRETVGYFTADGKKYWKEK
jgi:hypothetical protein